jgi:hypothetical protein
MHAQQLPLWDDRDASPVVEEDLAELILCKKTWWADGDTRPERLDRLALLCLGELESWTRNDGVKCFFRVISTGVVDGEVVMACQYLCTANEFFGGKDTGPVEDDGEVD